MRKGAICGAMAGLGSVVIILAEELPAVPAAMVWQMAGLILISVGAWVPLCEILKEAR